MRLKDRTEAGRLLAERLAPYRGQDVVVLGLPRGGVPVAAPIARALGAPLDVIVARKLGAPNNAEFAIGAVTARGTRVLNDAVLRQVLLAPGYLDRETQRQREVAARREADLRGVRAPVPLADRTVILVDDGVATGMTMRAAIADARAQRPAELVVAAPVMAPATAAELEALADRVVALDTPDPFYAVGQFYDDFTQTTDETVRELLFAGATKDGKP